MNICTQQLVPGRERYEILNMSLTTNDIQCYKCNIQECMNQLATTDQMGLYFKKENCAN